MTEDRIDETGGVVLVVDDSPETLGMVMEALEGAGLTTLVARDGAAALRLLDRISPDVILLDAVMPVLDGFETCRRIKARSDQATTPVVFMTGLSDSAHIVAGLQAGGVDYLTKPIRPDELIARIAVHVANARMIAQARSALDSGGRGVAAFRVDGTLVWASPRARDLLGRDAISDDGFIVWLQAASTSPLSSATETTIVPAGAERLRLSIIGRSAGDDVLVGVALGQTEPPSTTLSRALGLTLREGQVLEWLSRGKSNRDIAAILGLSPRTVTKHVEQIFQKLGVENRTSAASIALKQIGV
jgi:DNA-binding NarL/FixJ family response regulator